MISSFLHSCGRGPIKLFLVKEDSALETGALELAIDTSDYSVAILPKALPRLLGPSPSCTGLMGGITTGLIYRAR